MQGRVGLLEIESPADYLLVDLTQTLIGAEIIKSSLTLTDFNWGNYQTIV